MGTPEFLANVLNSMEDSGLRTFRRKLPIVFELTSKNSKMETKRIVGPYLKSGLVYDAAGTVQKITRGDEPLTFARKPMSKHWVLKTGISRLTGAPHTQLELDQWKNTNPDQVAVNALLENDKNFEHMYYKALESYLTMAAVPAGFTLNSFNQYQTLNGEYTTTSSGVVGVSGGLIEFLAPASQTNTVQGLAKSTAYGWFNQYRDSSGFAGDSYDAIKRVMTACEERSMKSSMPQKALMDLESFIRFQRMNAANTIIIADKAAAPNEFIMDGFAQGMYEHTDKGTGLRAIRSPQLDLSNFVGTGVYGVTYLLTEEDMFFVPEGDTADFGGRRVNKPGSKEWEVVQPHPGVETYVGVKTIEWQIGVNNLMSQGVVTGTAK
jgi:hypothetical protein